VLYLKVLALAASLGGAWFLERTALATTGTSPAGGSQKAVEALYLFSWNPLVLLLAVGSGHNDMVMMALVLMACWLMLRESWALAFAALAVSVWVKYVTVVLVPLFGLYALRRTSLAASGKWPRAFGGGLCMLAISALVFLPFGAPKWVVEWAGGLPERLLVPRNWAGNGTGLWVTLSNHSSEIMGAGLILFAVAYATILGRFARKEGTFGELMGASFLVLLAAFLLGVARSQPWHLIWATALAGLAPSRWAWVVAVLLSAMMLLSQVWVEWGTPGLVHLTRPMA
jgi:alpha-1,6-mannosyltransferase